MAKEESVFETIGTLLFGKRLTPEEMVKKWKRDLNKERRELDRNLRGIEREEMKAKREIKAAAKRGDMGSAKMLAKELVRSKHAKERITISKAQLNSVSMQLSENLAMYKLVGALKKSTEIMSLMNNLVRMPEMHAVMMAMAREMEKAGLIEEVVSETLEEFDDDIEEEADEEVQKILDEWDIDFKEAAPDAGKTRLAGRNRVAEAEADDLDEPLPNVPSAAPGSNQ